MEHIQSAGLVDSHPQHGLSFSVAAGHTLVIPTGFVQLVDTGLVLVPPLPQPRVGSVFTRFLLHSDLCAIIKTNTLNERMGLLNSDPSSAPATCGTIHKHSHLLNKYLNEHFLHIRYQRYKNG